MILHYCDNSHNTTSDNQNSPPKYIRDILQMRQLGLPELHRPPRSTQSSRDHRALSMAPTALPPRPPAVELELNHTLGSATQTGTRKPDFTECPGVKDQLPEAPDGLLSLRLLCPSPTKLSSRTCPPAGLRWCGGALLEEPLEPLGPVDTPPFPRLGPSSQLPVCITAPLLLSGLAHSQLAS